ncbi:MAG: hypothetical protein KM310_04455 [Clostridiales bacterium]|nr:hypothetical protein [Clostridiales bacterium]
MAVLLLGVVAGCGSTGGNEAQAPGADQPTPGGTAVILVNANPVSLDPAFIRDWTTRQAAHYLYDTLVYVDENDEIQPLLAESWQVSEDGLVYTFHLREGVRFHDGTPFDAEAVKINMDRLLDPEVGSRHLATLAPMIDKVEAVDPLTVRFYLKRPDANFLPEMSWSSMMASPKALETYGKDFGQHPVGTGPFRFQSFEPDSSLELVANEDYWQGRPLLDGLKIRVVPEKSSQLVEMEAGNGHVVYSVPPKDVKRLRDAGIIVEERTTASYQMLALNLASGPTSELAVRKAIARAIDRDAIIEKVLYGYAEKSRAGVPSASPYYNEDVPMVEYNPEEAKALLDEAGWKEGPSGAREKDGQPLFVKILTSDDEQRVLISQIVAEQLEKIGFKTKIETLEWASYLEAMRAGRYHISFWSLGGFSLPASDGSANLKSDAYWNVSQIKDAPDLKEVAARIDGILDRSDVTADPQERREILKEFQLLTQEYQLKVWLWHAKGLTAISPQLRDYQLYNYDIVWLPKAWLKR